MTTSADANEEEGGNSLEDRVTDLQEQVAVLARYAQEHQLLLAQQQRRLDANQWLLDWLEQMVKRIVQSGPWRAARWLRTRFSRKIQEQR